MAGLSRRDLLVGWLRRPALEPEPMPAPPAYLRPPGASERRVVSLCDGCAECADACPHDAIVMLGEAYDSPGTPAVFPTAAPCRMCDDVPCAAACPTDALRPLPSDAIRLGVARVATQRCWAAMSQPCDYCITACPLDPPAIRSGDSEPIVDAERCRGCGLCEFYCTATPKAIAVGAAL